MCKTAILIVKIDRYIMENELILGLDVSTHCIGITVALDTGSDLKILQVTHIRPKVPSKIKGTEALFLKSKVFADEIRSKYADYGITTVVIEEPLFASQNQMTVSTLLRFNGMISQSIYDILGVVPQYISSYDARKYGFPELMAVRKYNKAGNEYDTKHIRKALKKNELVLFGEYPWDCAKKLILWNKISEMYPEIQWVYNNKGELKNENFDASDSLVCVLGYLGKQKYGDTEPEIGEYKEKTIDNATVFTYNSLFCGKEYNKEIILS